MALKVYKDAEFHNIDCLEEGDNYGFEGCYNDDLNHPDPRPAHRIWINKLHAEKLYKLFRETDDYECPECNSDAGWSEDLGYCCICGYRRDAIYTEGEKDE